MVIGNFYLQRVQELGSSCPRRLQTNPGTKNGTMATIQCYLRRHEDDGLSGGKPIVMALQPAISGSNVGGRTLKGVAPLGI